jgi:ATP-dependent Clp protease ATP-binding subunit ClpB
MIFGAGQQRQLDLNKRSLQVEAMITGLKRRIVGQDEAVGVLADIVETFNSGLCDPRRPVGTALFLGMTGSGKTATVEAACEVLFGDKRACLTVECSEYVHSHEIAKLIGSPAGYLGHRETPALLNQKRLMEFHTPSLPLNIVQFSEIEKASDSLWQLMLGIMDKALLTLGTNEVTCFSQSIIICTSNLGAKDMSRLLLGKGFGYQNPTPAPTDKKKIDDIALEAAKKHFTPEWMNRIDHVVVFNTLTEANVREIMAIEMGLVQAKMWEVGKFLYYVTPSVKDAMFKEGFSTEYGAREMKRTLDRRIRLPLARLLASKQIEPTDRVSIDVDKDGVWSYTLTKIEPQSQTEGDVL